MALALHQVSLVHRLIQGRRVIRLVFAILKSTVKLYARGRGVHALTVRLIVEPIAVIAGAIRERVKTFPLFLIFKKLTYSTIPKEGM